MLRQIYLHGPLAEKYGKEPFVFKADNFRQLMNGLRVFCPGIQTELRKYTEMCIVKKRGSEVQSIPQEEVMLNFGTWDEIHIAVSVTAAGAEAFAAMFAEYGAVAVAAAYVAYTIVLSYVLGAIIQGMQDTITTEKAAAENKSALFNGPENRSRQGARVQLNYGRFRVGSVTLNQQMSGVRQPLTANDNLSLMANTAASVNVFANDYFKTAPVAITFEVNGVTTSAGSTYTYTGAGCTVTCTTAGLLTVTSTAKVAKSFKVTVNSTDAGVALTQYINVVISVPQEQYYNGDGHYHAPGYGGNGGDAAGAGTGTA